MCDEIDDIYFNKCSDDYYYVDTFPREWIEDHADNQSGPLYCSNCEAFGTIIQDGRIIFLGYCLNCASYIYHDSRGSGFQGFDNITDMETIKNGGDKHLEKYREQIIAYITNRLNDTNFELQFPVDVQSSEMSSSFIVSVSEPNTETVVPPITTVSVNQFDNQDCLCCDSYDDDNLSQKDSDPYSESSDDYGYFCDCCQPNHPRNQS